jgi:hypothetical protein
VDVMLSKRRSKAKTISCVSDTNPAIWGANLPGSPILGMSDEHEHMSEHLTMFAVGVQHWSDGTEAR